jgi:hypothetical protein
MLGFKAHAPKRFKRTQKLNKSRIVHQMVHFGSDSTLTDRFRIFFCKTGKNYFSVQLKILQSNLPEEQLEIQR